MKYEPHLYQIEATRRIVEQENLALFLEMVEDVLRDLSLLRRRRPPKFVEVTVEPLVDLGMEGVEMVADLLGCLVHLARFGLGGGAVLVSAANVDGVVAHQSGESGVDIS